MAENLESFEYITDPDDLYQGLNDEERRLRIAQEALNRAEDFVVKAVIDLKKALEQENESEHINNIPLCTQEYGTDCGIACARMVLQYYGIEDMGTNGFVAKGHVLGTEAIILDDVDGNPGPAASPDLIRKVLRPFNVDQQIFSTSGEDSRQIFIDAMLSDQPIEVGLPFSAIHPEDQRPRYHAIIVKGFRSNDSNDIEFVINDPKPEIGGEKTIDGKTLAKGLTKIFTVYQKIDQESEQ